MSALGLPPSTISAIVNDPTRLPALATSTSSSDLDGITAVIAQRVLGAYVSGFRTVFLLNAGLNAVATLAAILLIQHTELTRGDEEGLKKCAEDEIAAASESALPQDKDINMHVLGGSRTREGKETV